MLPERWLPVVGYEGKYEVSDNGRVRTLMVSAGRGGQRQRSEPRIVKARTAGPMKYPYVALWDGTGRKRMVAVHRVVLMAFVGPPEPGHEARHIDSDPSNPRLGNLVWGTKAENMADKIVNGTDNRGEKHVLSKLTSEAVRAIRHLHSRGVPMLQLGKQYGVSPSVVRRVVRFEAWRHV